MTSLKLCKFGGSSLANAKNLEKVAAIIKADERRRIIVCSAPGKRDPSDSKVTDLLIRLASAKSEAVPALCRLILARYENFLLSPPENRSQEQRDNQQLGFLLSPPEDGSDLTAESAELMQMLTDKLHKAVSMPNDHLGRRLDYLKSLGEEFMARILAAKLRDMGQEAVFVDAGEAGMTVEGDYAAATASEESFSRLRERLLPCLREGKLLVIPGFYGMDASAERKTLSRGGSDVSAAVLAAALDGCRCEIFSDVNGVLDADPRLIPEAASIPRLSYEQMLALARYGADVLHPDAVLPLKRYGVPLRLANTFQPQQEGTLVGEEDPAEEASVKAVSCLSTEDAHLRLAVIGCFRGQGLAALERRLEAMRHGFGSSIKCLPEEFSEQARVFLIPEAEKWRMLHGAWEIFLAP